MKKGNIYKITSPSGKIYIGQTLNMTIREKDYRRMSRKSKINQPKIFYSIQKYGWDKHLLEVIDKDIWQGVNNCILDLREKYWIKEYNTFNNGLNCNEGGNNPPHSEEIKNKIRLSKLGKKLSQQHRDNIGKAMTGLKMPEKTRLALRKANTGREMSEDHKNILRKKLTGVPMTEDIKKKISDANKGKPWSDIRRSAQEERNRNRNYK